jgi:hypothetical protein
MRCLRIYATPDGESHFDEIDIPTTKRPVFPDIAPFELSAHYPASRIRFTRIPAAMHEVGYHTVPERVLTVRLDGSVEYETSDGEVRHVQAGSFVLVEDTHGKGTSLAIPQRGRPLFGLRCQTASICHPGNPLAALSARPEGDLAAVSTLMGLRGTLSSPCPLLGISRTSRDVCFRSDVRSKAGVDKHRPPNP